jgi:hypothetical protein
MIRSTSPTAPVECVLRRSMIIDGEEVPAGEVVELKPRDYRYLHTHSRVLPATKDNVAAVKEEIAQRKALRESAAKATDVTVNLQNQLTAALAEIERLKGGKK